MRWFSSILGLLALTALVGSFTLSGEFSFPQAHPSLWFFGRMWLLLSAVSLFLPCQKLTRFRLVSQALTIIAGGAALISSNMLLTFIALEIALFSIVWERIKSLSKLAPTTFSLSMISGFLLMAVSLAWIVSTLDVSGITEISQRFLPRRSMRFAAVGLLFGVAMQLWGIGWGSESENESKKFDNSELLRLGIPILLGIPVLWKIFHLGISVHADFWSGPFQVLGLVGLSISGVAAVLATGFVQRFKRVSLAVLSGMIVFLAQPGNNSWYPLAAIAVSWSIGVFLAMGLQEHSESKPPKKDFTENTGRWLGVAALAFACGLPLTLGFLGRFSSSTILLASEQFYAGVGSMIGWFLCWVAIGSEILHRKKSLVFAKKWGLAWVIAILLVGLVYSLFPGIMEYFPGVPLLLV